MTCFFFYIKVDFSDGNRTDRTEMCAILNLNIHPCVFNRPAEIRWPVINACSYYDAYGYFIIDII